MAQYLYRLGHWSVRQRKFVALLWVVVLVLGITGAVTLSGETSDNFELPGTESQEAIDQLGEKMPGVGGATARVVFQTPDGATLEDPRYVAAIAETVESLNAAPGVMHATNPIETMTVSPDLTVAFSNVSYSESAMELTSEIRDALVAAPDAARDAGLTVEFGGDALMETPHAGAAEVIGLGVAIVVLLITFGSVVAAGLPIITALIGVGIGMAGITIATRFIDMSSTAPTLAIMLGLAVGIDYALFIVTRHRQLMADGLEPGEAAAQAVATAGSAVGFAGATVIIALLGLFVVGIPFLTVMGFAAAATVLGAVVIAVTLLPALLGFAGTTIDRFRVPGLKIRSGLGTQKDSMGLRWGKFVVRRATPVLLVSLVGLGVFAIPASQIEMGLPDDGVKSTESTARRAFDILADSFGPGMNGPLIVTVDPGSGGDLERAAAAVQEAVTPLDNVMVATPPTPNPEGDFAIINVIPLSGPSDRETATLVHDIREVAKNLEDTNGVTVKVTGSAALNIDISSTLSSALPLYALVVVGLALVLLTMVFRSILVPIKAALGFLLSVVVSFGASVAVFQWGWLKDLVGLDEPGPIISVLPILLLGILFGLAMDYEVFLISRIREDYVRNGDARLGIQQGLRHSSRVIVAAGMIMVAVFSAFILSSDANVKMIGFALAIGVFADAFVVRMAMVPAVLALLGDRAWKIPSWLDRIIPNIDIEGESLELETPTTVPLPEGTLQG